MREDRRRISPQAAQIDADGEHVKKRAIIELVALVLTGLTHVVIEILHVGVPHDPATGIPPHYAFSVVAVFGWGVYLAIHGIRRKGMAREWGFRRAGFWGALRLCLVPTLVGVALLVLAGKLLGNDIPPGFWLIFALYPLSGIAQQFALQSLVARNLTALVRRTSVRIICVAAIFSLAHFPNYMLMLLTFVVGLWLTWVFERYRNVWAVGLVHGILGALAYYCLLGHDPGGVILGWLI
jgi:membrane protease YdiL (CAAX protease family)